MHDASAGDAESRSGSADTAPAEEPESPFARRAKLIALLLAATAVVVSMVVAAMQASDPTEPTGDEESAVGRAGITGAAALGGFSLPASSDRTDRDTSADAASPAAAREGDGTAMPQTETVADVAHPADVEALDELPNPGDEPRETEATTTDAGVAHTDAEASSSTPVDPQSAVRDFYDLVSSAPETALAKVSPTLVGDEREQLLRVWRSLTSVEVEQVHPETAGSVRVVVTMKPEYGPSLRITQLLGFSDGPHPVINRATLLSIKTM